ncbi:DUF6089 family protein [Ferruginibacter sp.]
MKSVFNKTVLTIFFVSGTAYYSTAQINLSKYEIGLNAGVFVYQGDLTPQQLGSYKTMKPQLALQLYRILNPYFSVRLNINRGKLYGNDAVYSNPDWRKYRNFNFTTPVTELSVQAVWNITNRNNTRLTPYLFAGAGLSFVKIKRDWSNIDPTIFPEDGEVMNGLATDAARSLPRTIPVIPAGVGLRYALSDRISLTAETSYRFSFTDYLDGFSQSANPNKNDHYLSHSIGIIYSFNKKNRTLACPVMRY